MKNCLFLSLSISSFRWKKVSGSEVSFYGKNFLRMMYYRIPYYRIICGSSPSLRPMSEPDSKGLRVLIDKHRIPCKILDKHPLQTKEPVLMDFKGIEALLGLPECRVIGQVLGPTQ